MNSSGNLEVHSQNAFENNDDEIVVEMTDCGANAVVMAYGDVQCGW